MTDNIAYVHDFTAHGKVGYQIIIERGAIKTYLVKELGNEFIIQQDDWKEKGNSNSQEDALEIAYNLALAYARAHIKENGQINDQTKRRKESILQKTIEEARMPPLLAED